jgi:hypothetical protein
MREHNSCRRSAHPFGGKWFPAMHSLKVWQGDQLLLAMEGSISISEDPNIRFTYVPDNSSSLRAEAVDTAGQVFSGSWPSAGVEPVE